MAADSATILVERPRRDRPGVNLTSGGTAAGLARYRDLFTADPFTDFGLDRVVTLTEHLGPAGLARAPDLRRFLEDAGVAHILGADLVEPGGARVRLRICRNAAQGDFSEADKARLARFLEPVRRSVGRFLRLMNLEAERNLYADVLERLRLGVALVDGEGRVLHASDGAQAFMKGQDGRLRLDLDAASARALAALVGRSVEVGPDAAPAIRTLQRADGEGRLSVAVRAPRHPDKLDAPMRGAAVLILADPDRGVAPRAEALSALFGLTGAEADLAVLVARGLTLDEASVRLGVAKNTARAHLRAIFAKTGVARQSALVRLLLRSVDELQ